LSDDHEKITLNLLNAVQRDSSVTQRTVAEELGVALGLVNAYLKRCVKKGYIKIRQVPANRYAYYLTPEGFAEKSRLTAEYLSHSFTFFRNARRECSEILQTCERNGWKRIAVAGKSDLAEIAILCANELPVTIVGIIDDSADCTAFLGYPLAKRLDELKGVDAVLVADLTAPQKIFENLAREIPRKKILCPSILGVSRVKPKLQA